MSQLPFSINFDRSEYSLLAPRRSVGAEVESSAIFFLARVWVNIHVAILTKKNLLKFVIYYILVAYIEEHDRTLENGFALKKTRK